MAGSSLVAGMMVGLILLDATAWARGEGFSGASILACALLGTMALLPGVACWAAGRKLMRDRGDEPLCAPRTARLIAAILFILGTATAMALGIPAPPA
jgi:hypothetical protein